MGNFQRQSGQKFEHAEQGQIAQLSNVGLSEVRKIPNVKQDEINKLSNKELLKLCQNCGSNIRKLQRQFAVYLIEVNKRCVCRDWGFHSIGEFAAKLAGMGSEIVNRILNVAQKLEDKPKLMALMLECGWAKLEIVANIVEPETQDFWVEKVKTMSLAVLQKFVQEIRNQELFKKNSNEKQIRQVQKEEKIQTSISPNLSSGTESIQEDVFEVESNTPQQQALIQGFVNEAANMAENFQKASITIHVRPEIEGKLRLFKFKLEKQQKKALNWEDVMEEFLKMAEEGVEVPRKVCKKSQKTEVSASVKKVSEKMVPAKSQKRKSAKPTRHILVETQRQLKVQYYEMCGYPGCNKPAENKHHTKRFSLEHVHEAIVPLCKIHHQLAHHGLIKNEEMVPIDARTGAPNWKLQLRADERAPKFKVDQLVQKFRMSSAG
ncbi:MAG: hypothetical protein WC843_05460 [Candidatus Gracilibacteria bacterium]